MTEPPAIRANKDELARALDWSKPRLDAFLKDHHDAPKRENQGGGDANR